jgi:hypothetical protein
MTQTIPLGSDARERFVLEIAQVLAPERIVEAHFFAPLRQGQIETGVCVLAALPEGADPLPSETSPSGDAASSAVLDHGVSPAEPATERAESASGDHQWSKTDEHPERTAGAAETDGATGVAETDGATGVAVAAGADADGGAEGAAVAADDPGTTAAFPEGARISSRHVVYSARYRWTRKGPERGKWECEVVAEADAPLLTVEAVVQGVQHRSSEPLEVQKVDGDAVRAMVAQARQQWPTTA